MEEHRPRTSTPNRAVASGPKTDVDWIEDDEPGREEPDPAPLATARTGCLREELGVEGDLRGRRWSIEKKRKWSIDWNEVYLIDIHFHVHHRK
jgi:hypothetical protein